MKRTVLHAGIDGYEIVAGFGEATIDAVATWAAIQGKVITLDELAQLNGLKAKIAAQADIANSSRSLANSALKAGNQVGYNSYTEQAVAAEASIASMEAEFPLLAAAFEEARTALMAENAEYCLPNPASEQIISDEEYARIKPLFEALGENEQLLLAGGTVKDFRGEKYWLKKDAWISVTISALGEAIPKGAVLESQLTDAQSQEISDESEANRISALTAEEKAAELKSVLQATAQSASNQKQVADITGEPFDASAWYQAQKIEIEKKYA